MTIIRPHCITNSTVMNWAQFKYVTLQKWTVDVIYHWWWMSEWVYIIGAMTVTWKSEVVGEKPVPVPLLSTAHTSVATGWHSFVKVS